MHEFLSGLFSLSIGGALVIVLLALLAHFSRSRYGARWRCWIWLLLCLRLALPVSLSLPKQEAPIQLPIPEDVVLFDPAPAPEPAPSEPPAAVAAPLPKPPAEAAPHPHSISVFQIVFLCWALGAGGVALWAILSHLRFLTYLRRWGQPVQDGQILDCFRQQCQKLSLRRPPRLKCCTGLRAPMLAGLFRPVLLLPDEALQEPELRYGLLHELAHHRRHDILLKSLALAAVCVHWFNPAVWYLAHLLERDTELACDELVLRHLPKADHSAYGETILHAVERLKAAA